MPRTKGVNLLQKTTRADRVLFIILAVLALALFFASRLFMGGEGREAVISIDGKQAYRLPLDQNTTLPIDRDGYHNLIVIQDGQAVMAEANCRDQICVHQGKARPGAPVVCLPNRVMVEISGSAEADDGLDAVVH